MKIQASKTQHGAGRSLAAPVVQAKSLDEPSLQLKKNRPETLGQRKSPSGAVQLMSDDEDYGTAQMMSEDEDYGTAQMMFEDEDYGTAQMMSEDEDYGPAQMMSEDVAALQLQPVQRKENNTGLPDNLKTGVENLSGYSMDDVQVHYNSDKPSQLQAHAYAQGADIHVASGQEKHLPHEAWHVVQQKQGRVQPTMQLAEGVDVNDDAGLEKEADVMGAKALQMQ